MNVKYYNDNGDEMTFEEVMKYCTTEEILPMQNNIIRLKMQIGKNRDNMVIALAEAGYKVWIEEEEIGPYSWSGTNYYVCFENEQIFNSKEE